MKIWGYKTSHRGKVPSSDNSQDGIAAWHSAWGLYRGEIPRGASGDFFFV